jgi:modulator of FtsH protease HflC
MNRIKLVAILAALGVGTYVLMSSIYTVSEVEQAIVTQFGMPVGEPVTTAGLKFKVPFIQDVNLIDKRVLEWDGNPSDMPTKDKLYVSVDLFARWRIVDPLQYFLRLHDERSAQSRLDDILGSETRNAIAKHELIEIVRTTKDRVPQRDALMVNAGRELDVGSLVPIQKGRKLVEQEIFAEAAEKVGVFGIALLDIRFKRINYNESVRPKIYDRMISERRQIAERFLSEGNGEAARIRGNRVRDLNKIQSEAYRQVEEIRGVADHAGLQVHNRRKHDPRPFYGRRPVQIPEEYKSEKRRRSGQRSEENGCRCADAVSDKRTTRVRKYRKGNMGVIVGVAPARCTAHRWGPW